MTLLTSSKYFNNNDDEVLQKFNTKSSNYFDMINDVESNLIGHSVI